MSDVKISSNRSFGVVFFVVFLLIALYPVINNEEIRAWSLIVSLIFLVLGLLNSKILNPLNQIWFKFGVLLGRIISPFIMAIIFLCGGDFRTLILTNSMWIFKTLVQQKLKFFGGNHLNSCPVSDLRKN